MGDKPEPKVFDDRHGEPNLSDPLYYHLELHDLFPSQASAELIRTILDHRYGPAVGPERRKPCSQ